MQYKPQDGKDVGLLHLIVAPLAVAELLATKKGPTHATEKGSALVCLHKMFDTHSRGKENFFLKPVHSHQASSVGQTQETARTNRLCFIGRDTSAAGSPWAGPLTTF